MIKNNSVESDFFKNYFLTLMLFLLIFSFFKPVTVNAQGIKKIVNSTNKTIKEDYYTKGYNSRKNNKNIIVEAEYFERQIASSQRQWYVVSTKNKPKFRKDPDDFHLIGASEGSYLELLPDTLIDEKEKKVEGKNYSKTPGKMAVLSYNVDFESSGRYYVWVRGYSTSAYDNSIHVGLNNSWPESGKQLYLCKKLMNKWSWSSNKFANSESCISTKRVYIDIERPGFKKLMFSMREDGFEFDKFLLTKNEDFIPN